MKPKDCVRVMSVLDFYNGKSFFSNLNTPIINVTMAMPARIANFHAKAIVPFNMETVSNSDIIERKLNTFMASILIAEGTTLEPNSPKIVHTSMKIESPPPIDIEYFDLLKIAEHMKQ